jgi:Tfp pilus assembly protein PilP
MNNLMIDLWPFLLPVFLGIVVAYARHVHTLNERVSVLERSNEDIQKDTEHTMEEMRRTMERNNDAFQKIIDNIQKRQDSHSKKQDDVVTLLTQFKMEMLEKVGTMSSNVSVLATDVKNLSNLISITDVGLKIDRGER